MVGIVTTTQPLPCWPLAVLFDDVSRYSATSVSDRRSKASMPSRIIELVGLAGAGKSTLARALCRMDERIHVAEDLALRNGRHLALFARSMATLLPLVVQAQRRGRAPTLDELKALAYLEAWPRFLRQEFADPGSVILLDHGPIFKCATLWAFGPEQLRQALFIPWWHSRLREWAQTLDRILWLYAPEELLIQRINARSQRHAVKGRPIVEATTFLGRYQAAYDQVLTALAAQGGPRPVALDSSRYSAAYLAAQILATLGQGHSTTSRVSA
ncbi:MAG: hypothetical protein KatS3mg050_4068 [Litorilinea sp.]|uniref:AAA family ATPase n=2 Tax=Litorilinea aerophila TaxID=1204385 RepID=A0A540V9I0_9CHLR|nr:MAG: hypothetical protein KatS3mg050_4068 [Litorilinea sp.]